VLGYIVDIVGATRHSPSLQLGVSPRGATALLSTSRSWAWLSGRNYVTPDMRDLAKALATHMDKEFPGTVTVALDGNFPFVRGFPLLPHLSRTRRFWPTGSSD